MKLNLLDNLINSLKCFFGISSKNSRDNQMNNCSELRDCLQILVHEYFSGYHFLGISKRLKESRQKHSTVNKEFDDYLFSDLEHATLENSYFHLFRVLEHSSHSSSEDRPVSFRHFLKLALENCDCFNFTSTSEIKKMIKSDQQWATPKKNKQIQHLMNLRNNGLAHISRKRLNSLDSERVTFIIEIDFREPGFVEKLYHEFGQKLNNYNQMLNGAQLDDYDKILPHREEEKLFSLLERALRI